MRLLFVGDLHVGSNSAIAPQAQIKTPQQEWIYSQWRAMLKTARPPFVLMLGGDLIDGPAHHGNLQTWGNHADQRDGAVELLMPLVNKAEDVYAVRGTEAHVGDDGEDDRAIARELGAVDLGHSAKLDIDGKRLWWAHHGLSVGRMAWTKHNGLVSACRNASYNAEPPRWIIGHHAHTSPAPVTIGAVTAAIVPCWQLPTPWARGKFPHSGVDIGVLWLDTETEKIERVIYAYEEETIKLNKGGRKRGR
jgi:hypothetical protein